jgi:CHAT domain-containing protein
VRESVFRKLHTILSFRLLLKICLLAVSFQTVVGQSSTEIPSLQLNQPLSGILKNGESRKYRLRADAGMLVRVVIVQQGVDVAVQAFDPQGTRVARSDDSFGRTGPQPLEFVAEKTTEYVIEVLARPNELGGNYEIRYVEMRPVTNTDRTRLAARSYLAAGNTRRNRISPATVRAAMVEYAKALALYKQANDQAGQAVVLHNIARLYESQSDYRKALENYSATLPLWRAVSDRRGEAYAISSIGTMHLYLGNLEPAHASFVEAGPIHRELGNKEWEALSYQEIGNVYRQRGDLTKALTYFQQALPIFREVGAKTRTLYVLSNIGAAYEGLGDLQQAAAYQNQALNIGREINLSHGISLALYYLGDIYAQRGETRQALSFYQQALPSCLDIGDDNCAGRTYRRLGSIYDSLGEAQTALDYYAKGAAIYRQKERPVELARVLNSSGRLYSLLGDKKRAVTFHLEALAVSRSAQSRQDEAESLSDLAELYEDEAQTKKAREFYQQALAINREIKNRLGEAKNLNRLGLLAKSAGNNTEATALFEQSLRINNDAGARYNGALALNNLGVVSDATGNAKLALEYFTKALTVLREIENRNGEALMLYRVAATQKKLGQLEEARRNITTALEIVETIRGKIASTDLRASYFATVQQYYDLYIELLMQEHRARPNDGLNFTALQTSEQARARSLLDLLQEAGADVRQNVDASLLAREKELVELINGKATQQTLLFANPRKVELAKTLGEEIGRLEIEYETLQSAIRENNPRFGELTRGRPLGLTEIQRLLDERTLLLEYKLGDERSYLWVISQTKFESYELPRHSEIEGEARRFYELLTERNRASRNETITQRHARIQAADQNLQALAERLHRTLLAPVRPAGGQRLVIVGDGTLQYVPFSALSANENISLPSIAVLHQLRREGRGQSPAKSVAVFADPVFESDDPRLAPQFRRKIVRLESVLAQAQSDFDFGANGRGLPRLFASREEAKAILALAPAGASYGALDFEASRERAMNAELSQYRVLHFATHALLNHVRPQLSGVVLSLFDEEGKERDGFLRLNQIYNLRLSSDLVVLSACSTALGKDVRGEGLVGLTRGFMYAGAPRVIASLWKVDDEATAELMKLFYRNLLNNKVTPSQALTAAQAEMRTQARWRSPYYWAAFTLQGDWQ